MDAATGRRPRHHRSRLVLLVVIGRFLGPLPGRRGGSPGGSAAGAGPDDGLPSHGPVSRCPTAWRRSERRRQGGRPGWPRWHGPAVHPDLGGARAQTIAAAAARCMAMSVPTPAGVDPGKAVAAASVRSQRSGTSDAASVQRATRRKRCAGLSERRRITASTPVAPSAPAAVRTMVGPGPASGGNSRGDGERVQGERADDEGRGDRCRERLQSGLPEASRRRAPVWRCGHRLDPLPRPDQTGSGSCGRPGVPKWISVTAFRFRAP